MNDNIEVGFIGFSGMAEDETEYIPLLSKDEEDNLNK